MEIGFNTDGLGFLSFEKMLKTIVSLGIKNLNFRLVTGRHLHMQI